jgi:hypothetical protein
MAISGSRGFVRWSARPAEWIPLAVLVAALVGWSACIAGVDRGHVGTLMDDGLYFVSAQALRDGRGYTLPSQPGPPARARYPIGLPALLALALRLAPGEASLARDLAVSKTVIMSAAWVFLLGAYFWLRRVRVSACVAVLIVLAVALHPATGSQSVAIASDVPFAAVAWLLLMRWASPRTKQAQGGARRSFVDGILAGAACLIRGNGITLFLGSLVAACLKSRRRLASLVACALGAALLGVPLEAYAWLHSGARMSSSYSRELAAGWESLGAVLSAIGRNLVLSADALSYIVAPVMGTNYAIAHPLVGWPVRVGVWLLLSLGTAELVRITRRRDLPVWTHVAGTFLVFWLWPWKFTENRLLSLFPLIFWAFSRGAGVLARVLGGSSLTSRRLGVLALVLTLASGAAISGRLVWRAHTRGEMWADARMEAGLDAVLNVVRTRLEKSAIITSMTPELVYLYTGRQGTMMIDDGDRLMGRLGRREGIEAAMRENPGRPFYLLSAPPDSSAGADADQATALAHDPVLALREIYRTPDGRYWLAAISLRRPAAGRGS